MPSKGLLIAAMLPALSEGSYQSINAWLSAPRLLESLMAGDPTGNDEDNGCIAMVALAGNLSILPLRSRLPSQKGKHTFPEFPKDEVSAADWVGACQDEGRSPAMCDAVASQSSRADSREMLLN